MLCMRSQTQCIIPLRCPLSDPFHKTSVFLSNSPAWTQHILLMAVHTTHDSKRYVLFWIKVLRLIHCDYMRKCLQICSLRLYRTCDAI